MGLILWNGRQRVFNFYTEVTEVTEPVGDLKLKKVNSQCYPFSIRSVHHSHLTDQEDTARRTTHTVKSQKRLPPWTL